MAGLGPKTLERIVEGAGLGLLLGLVLGYLLFGRILGEWVPVSWLLPGEGTLESIVKGIVGINEIREKILVLGAFFGVLGGVCGYYYDRVARSSYRSDDGEH